MGKKIGELPEATSSDGLHLVAFDQTAKKTYKLSSSKVKGAEPRIYWIAPSAPQGGESSVEVLELKKFRVVIQATRGSGWDEGRLTIDIDLDIIQMSYEDYFIIPFLCTDEYDTTIPHVGYLKWFQHPDSGPTIRVDTPTLAYQSTIIAVYEL